LIKWTSSIASIPEGIDNQLRRRHRPIRLGRRSPIATCTCSACHSSTKVLRRGNVVWRLPRGAYPCSVGIEQSSEVTARPC
jgi:hypothetical protein